MQHEMKLNPRPFSLIKEGRKRVELRLFDEKRRLLQVGDELLFTSPSGERLLTKIIALQRFADFFALYRHFDKISIGYIEDEEARPEDMYEYYSKEDIEKYGVLAVCIEKI